MSLFEAEFKSWADDLLPAEKSVYDYVEYDSGVESALVEAIDGRNNIKLYVKLPSWFVIPTPVGNYNPDNPDGEKLYLVRETKGKGDAQ